MAPSLPFMVQSSGSRCSSTPAKKIDSKMVSQSSKIGKPSSGLSNLSADFGYIRGNRHCLILTASCERSKRWTANIPKESWLSHHHGWSPVPRLPISNSQHIQDNMIEIFGWTWKHFMDYAWQDAKPGFLKARPRPLAYSWYHASSWPQWSLRFSSSWPPKRSTTNWAGWSKPSFKSSFRKDMT